MLRVLLLCFFCMPAFAGDDPTLVFDTWIKVTRPGNDYKLVTNFIAKREHLVADRTHFATSVSGFLMEEVEDLPEHYRCCFVFADVYDNPKIMTEDIIVRLRSKDIAKEVARTHGLLVKRSSPYLSYAVYDTQGKNPLEVAEALERDDRVSKVRHSFAYNGLRTR